MWYDLRKKMLESGRNGSQLSKAGVPEASLLAFARSGTKLLRRKGPAQYFRLQT